MYGKIDATKVTEAVVFGQKRKGIWKLKGREGVWDSIDEDFTEINDQTVEEDGEGTLTEQAINAKTKCMSDAMSAVRKARQELTVEAPRLGLQEILSMAGFSVSDQVERPVEQADTAAVKNEGGEGADDGHDGDDTDTSDSDSDDAESGDASVRLGGYFASSSASTTASSVKAKAKVKVAAKATKGKAASSPKGKVALCGVKKPFLKDDHGPPASPKGKFAIRSVEKNAGEAAASGQGGGAEADIVRLDGRGLRLQAAAATLATEQERELNKISFDDDHEGVCLLGPAEIEFRLSLSKKGQSIAKAKVALKAMIGRIENAANSGALNAELVHCQKLQEKADLLAQFVEMQMKSVRDLNEAVSLSEVFFQFFLLHYFRLVG